MSVFSAIVAGCSLEWPGAPANKGGGEGGGPEASAGQNGASDWSFPGSDSSESSSGSSTSGGTSSGGGGSDFGSPACSWGEPTTVQLSFPGWRTLASPALARALTTAKKLPDPLRVSTTDFLNFYQVAYPPPPVPTDIGFYAGVLPGDLDKQLVLQVAVQAPVEYPRPHVQLAVVLDTSLSMAGEPWERAKAAVTALAGALQPGDSFTLVTAKHVQKTASDASGALAIADALELDAGEDLGGALDAAYQAVSGAQANDAVGRVVLITDGAAQATSIHLDVVAQSLQQGVPLIGVGVGDAPSYQGYFLDVATSNGGGANLYLDSAAAADALLRERFDELMITVASDVHVTVTLPESLHILHAPVPAQADSPSGIVSTRLNAGRTLVLRSTLETCDFSYASALGLPITIELSYQSAGLPSTFPGAKLQGFIGDLKHVTEPQMLKAGAIAAYADALANARAPLLEHAAQLAHDALAVPSLANDADLIEIEALIQADLAIIKAAD